jgi:formate C-acetyltransferase
MREAIRDRVIRADSERALILAEAYDKYKDIAPIIQRPLVYRDICEKMTLRIEDGELVVGNKAKHFLGSSRAYWALTTDIERQWEKRADGLWHNPAGEELRLCIAQEDIDLVRSVAPALARNNPGLTADAWQPDGAKEFFELEASDYGPDRPGVMMLPCGHLTPGWGKIINVGYGAIRKQAQDWMDARFGNVQGGDMSKYMFYKSAAIACDAVTTLIKRYSALASELAAQCAEPGRKAELEKMSGGLMWISENPARNFWEACQAAMLYQLFLAVAGGYPALAFGRFDQYTWPFLKKDLESGALTLDAAQEIVDAFFLKANCFYEGAIDSKLAQTTGIGNTYQHTTIGGVDPDTGEDATNPVTYMVLETVGRLKLHDPTISLRVNKHTPDELWGCALETSKLVGGLPLFQNDDVIIPGLMRELGFELRDARDYSIIGCQEIVGSGNDYPAPNGVHAPHASVRYGVIFDMAINNGINPLNGKQAPVHTGYLYEMNSIEEVRAAYEKMADYMLKWYVTVNNYAEYLTAYHMPHADLSISMEGCMENGMDAAAGGCKYNSYGGTATGLATIADCLTTVKYMCFDKKIISTRELYDAVMANWEGYEPLRQRILSEVPHYGNADPYADGELKWVVDLYYKQCSECSSQRSKVYKAGLYGASDHVAQGYHTWATPDGRKTGEPIADAMSPAQSRDKNGPMAVFISTCCFDHAKYMDGIALNLRMHPTVLSRDDGIAKLRDVTKTYFENGGLECQYNVVDTDTLRSAQKDPGAYRDLVVRIAGYSAYFVELNADCQNDIIARNENVL